MLLSVQQAARRLGVSPVTVRRWTATGFLPCTRTAGGHRRIDERDLDDLALVIGAADHGGAQLAREREVEVLIDTSIALARRLDLGELLHEIAARMTSLFGCHLCAISDYDPGSAQVITLAEYDDAGRRLPDASPYELRDYPLTRRVLEEQVTVVVNVDDPEADQAEVADLRRDGDRTLLMVPLVVQGDTMGLLEVVDQRRGREFSRQELRLAGAIAGQAAVAIQNARLFAARRRSDEDAGGLRRGITALTRHVPDMAGGGLLEAAARAACEALGAVSCVAAAGGETAGASGPGAAATHADARDGGQTGAAPDGGRGGSAQGAAAVLMAADPSGATDLTLTVTLAGPPGEGQRELLALIAVLTSHALRN